MLYIVQISNQEVEPKFCVDDIKFAWNSIYSVEEMDAIMDKLNEQMFTPEEVHFLTKYRIASFYNNELERNYRNDPNSSIPCIYQKDYIREEVRKKPFVNKGLEYLSVLISSGIITNCGEGYLFDNGQILITDEEVEKATELMFREFS